MKKILAGLFGVLVVMGGANAVDSIKAATTNTVRKSVYNINYGASGTTDGRGYRLGVTPQTNELNTARGASDIATTNVTVGNLASVTNSSGVASTGTNGAGHNYLYGIKKSYHIQGSYGLRSKGIHCNGARYYNPYTCYIS